VDKFSQKINKNPKRAQKVAKKSFVDELKKNKRNITSQRRGVVAVITHKDDISEGIKAGFTLMDIYSLLSDKNQMPVTYSTFIKLVRKYIKKKEEPNKSKEQKKSLQKKSSARGHGVYDPDNIDINELI
jgi:hypothetical protein